MEHDQIYTQNTQYMVSSKQCFEDMLVKQLYGSGEAMEDADRKQAINAALSQVASVGMSFSAEDLEREWARKKQNSVEDAGLLQLIAGTMAYLKVSWQQPGSFFK